MQWNKQKNRWYQPKTVGEWTVWLIEYAQEVIIEASKIVRWLPLGENPEIKKRKAVQKRDYYRW